MAVNANEYKLRVRRMLRSDGLRTINYMDVEPLAKRLKYFNVPRRILTLARKVEKEDDVLYTGFYCYPINEEPDAS